MSDFQDFLMEDFGEAEEVERKVRLAGKDRLMRFKPLTAAAGDELRKSCRKVTFVKGQKSVEYDQDAFAAKLITESTVYPDFKSKVLQDSWGVIGAENLLNAMKNKMLDGEYAILCNTVTEINGYDRSINEMVEEAKN